MQVNMTCSDCRGEGKKRSKLCSKCGGKGIVREQAVLKIKIPAGINNNETIRYTGQGEAGERGGGPGNLYLKIRVRPSTKFVRDDSNILSDSDLSIAQAVLGDKIEIETIDGLVSLKIPEGTEHGKVFILRGKGVPKLHGHGRGDHLVTVKIKIPRSLSRKQREIIKELGI